MNMNRDELLSYLTMLDFKAVDLQLYLDTHYLEPKAIAEYNETIKKADEIRYAYESQYGPLCSFRSMSDSEKFKWIDNPWPWEACFNYKMSEEA